MKKTLLSATVILSALFGFNSFAQTTQAVPENCNQKCEKSDCPRAGKRQMPNMFEGITLSADQQQKLEALRAENKQKRENRQKEQRDGRRQQRKSHLDQIKSILTPEQYTIFLENAYVNQMPMQKMGRHHGGKHQFDKNCNFKKNDRRGPRPDGENNK